MSVQGWSSNIQATFAFTIMRMTVLTHEQNFVRQSLTNGVKLLLVSLATNRL